MGRIPGHPQPHDDNRDVFPAISGHDGTQYNVIFSDIDGNIQVRNLVYDPGSMAWISSTGSTGSGSEVEVTNLPEAFGVLNGSSARINPATEGTVDSIKTSLAKGSTIVSNQISIDTDATLIRDANTNRKGIIIKNEGAVTMFIGASDVTTSTGVSIESGSSISLDKTTAAIYGVVATDTTTASYLEE